MNVKPEIKTDPSSMPDGYVLEDQVGHLIRRAHQRHTALFIAMIGDAQVTPTQYAALVKLYEMGELSQNHLGRLTAMDPATIQGVIRRLTGRKLISHRPDKNDKRRRCLSLTAGGRELVGRLLTNGPKVSKATLDPLSPAEQQQFLALLKRIT
ncbi:MarR family winged helix-turn-helix transcriptional regulator [Ferrovibrio sp.]|uniref:MarR family winged helix-turn-helix transcriptional regulator n=1 Tax=Ferrovibrio sp. TaxID=1917215 RepID=UPI00260EA32B|nr:MarR family winged helix-turn-helix transcriptional regulator [Ferrovibrio sp.]